MTSKAAIGAQVKKDLVLIDDDQVFCQLMKQHALKRGIEMDCFLNLAEMGSIGQFLNYRVAIVDYRLEQMTGIEVAEYFPVFFNQIPVILISQSPIELCGNAREKLPPSVKSFAQKSEGPEAILDKALLLRTIAVTPDKQRAEPDKTQKRSGASSSSQIPPPRPTAARSNHASDSLEESS